MSSEKDNILQFEQYMKSDKMSYVIYADIMLIKRKMDAQIIHKVLHQKKQTNKQTIKKPKQVNIFLLDIQCQQFGHLII